MTLPDAGFQFEHSYINLPAQLYTKIDPVRVKAPKLVILNQALAQSLGLDFSSHSQNDLAAMFSGNLLPAGAQPIAQAYAGHQFGHFTMLGDGRAHLLGEHIAPTGARIDIQFKGSGQTPYSRSGDGRAGLAPMLREYIIAEAMHALHIPTTRSLAVTTTGETIWRDNAESGAILTRIAASHLRVGSFQYVTLLQNDALIADYIDYALTRHYPKLINDDNKALSLLAAVVDAQIDLITHWMRAGFIHGVMNTDNMTISGETIDYGPCAFMDEYDPDTVFSAIDQNGRYRFSNQPMIAKWNLCRFAEAILTQIDPDIDRALTLAESILNPFDQKFEDSYWQMMGRKFGLQHAQDGDHALIQDFLSLLQKYKLDYTNSFIALMNDDWKDQPLFHIPDFKIWHKSWQARIQSSGQALSKIKAIMRKANPTLIPRNHIVDQALKAAAQDDDFTLFHALLEQTSKPYQARKPSDPYTLPPLADQRIKNTFCGT